MIYRLWDTDIGRLFGVFDTEDEALALVRSMVNTYGANYADDLALGREHGDGSFDEPSSSALLARLQEKPAPARSAVASGVSD